MSTTVTATTRTHTTAAKIGVSVLVTPLALALGFVVGVVLDMVLGGMSFDQGVVVYRLLLAFAAGGAVAAAWALVWRLMR